MAHARPCRRWAVYWMSGYCTPNYSSLRIGRFYHVRTNSDEVEPFMQNLAGSAELGTTRMVSDDRGFLIPVGYHDLRDIETPSSRHIASVTWGATLACAFFCLSKIVRQSVAAHRRRRLRNTYICLIWVTWVSTTVSSVVVWLWLVFFLPTSFWTFLAISLLWLVHMQCILQIVANRLTFLLVHHGRRIRWITFGIMTFLTVSGSCSYLPASIELNAGIVRFNSVWDRCIKVLFSTLDLTLNSLFLRLVYCKLVSAGLLKYWPLFWLNSCMVFISISLDVMVVCLESEPHDPTWRIQYVIFNVFVFMIKLYIELALAETIAYIAKCTTPCLHQTISLPQKADLERFGNATMIVPQNSAEDYMDLVTIPPTDLQEYSLTMHGGDGTPTSSVLAEVRRIQVATP